MTTDTKENAVLTIVSTQKTEDGSDKSELNTTASYNKKDKHTLIRYTELNETGEEVGSTLITVLSDHLVTIRKTGFTEAVMILETGKAHPVRYETMLGTMEMRLCATEIEPAFSEDGGTLRLEYLLDIGETYSAVNTIDLKVVLREPADRNFAYE